MLKLAQIILAASFACNALAAPSPFFAENLSGKFGEDIEEKFNEFFNNIQDEFSDQDSSGPSNDAGADGAQAVYFITNNAENSVVALPIGENGTLSLGSVTATGGAGSNAIDAATGDEIVPDALVSQSTVAITGNVSLDISDSIIRTLKNANETSNNLYRISLPLMLAAIL